MWRVRSRGVRTVEDEQTDRPGEGARGRGETTARHQQSSPRAAGTLCGAMRARFGRRGAWWVGPVRLLGTLTEAPSSTSVTAAPYCTRRGKKNNNNKKKPRFETWITSLRRLRYFAARRFGTFLFCFFISSRKWTRFSSWLLFWIEECCFRVSLSTTSSFFPPPTTVHFTSIWNSYTIDDISVRTTLPVLTTEAGWIPRWNSPGKCPYEKYYEVMSI